MHPWEHLHQIPWPLPSPLLHRPLLTQLVLPSNSRGSHSILFSNNQFMCLRKTGQLPGSPSLKKQKTKKNPANLKSLIFRIYWVKDTLGYIYWIKENILLKLILPVWGGWPGKMEERQGHTHRRAAKEWQKLTDPGCVHPRDDWTWSDHIENEKPKPHNSYFCVC